MTTTCNGCGNEFTAQRSDARYCSPKCRTAAHRQRTGQARKGPPPKRRPLTDTLRDRLIAAEKAMESLERALDDDRLSKHRQDIADHGGRWTLYHIAQSVERARAQLGVLDMEEHLAEAQRREASRQALQ